MFLKQIDNREITTIQSIFVHETFNRLPSTHNCFRSGSPSNAPWNTWTIRFSDNFNFSKFLISPKLVLSMVCSEFSPKSNLRRFVKLLKSVASIVTILFRLKSLQRENFANCFWVQYRIYCRSSNEWLGGTNCTYSCTMWSLIGPKSTSLMLCNLTAGKPPHFTFNPSAFSTILRHTHFSGQSISPIAGPLQ